MAKQSIFHNVVKAEPAYTQLLCNLLQRDLVFRTSFLERCGLRDASDAQLAEIRAEERLVEGYGRVDIGIRCPNLRLFIEIKTELCRGLQPAQKLDISGTTYLGWLAKEASADVPARLIFLVPSDWVHFADVKRQIAEERESYRSRGVEVAILPWAETLPIMKGNALLDEFALLVNRRFGPIGFSDEEKRLMFDENFPIDQVVKLIKLTNELKRSLGGKELDIQTQEFGFFLSSASEERCFYIGFGPDVSDDKAHLVYFGVRADVRERTRRAFIESLSKVYAQTAAVGGYLLGYVPKDDFDQHDALGRIEPKLGEVWNAVKEASERRSDD